MYPTRIPLGRILMIKSAIRLIQKRRFSP
uniref:Uncharacterized protein n=1 Tax=Romanomermis culicivorax TaxID=13658 RepID=A0A915HVG3_ROMCU